MCSVRKWQESSTATTKDSSVLLHDDSIVCSNIVFGTSNHNFVKYRHLKRVSINMLFKVALLACCQSKSKHNFISYLYFSFDFLLGLLDELVKNNHETIFKNNLFYSISEDLIPYLQEPPVI